MSFFDEEEGKNILSGDSIYDKLITRGNYYNFIKTPNCVWKMAFHTITPLFESWKPPVERVLKGKGRNEFARLRALTHGCSPVSQVMNRVEMNSPDLGH